MARENQLGLKSLVENTLGYRFSETENWRNPTFLSQKFLTADLEKAHKTVKREHRRNSGYYDPPYSSEAFREAKNLFETAKEKSSQFSVIDSAEEEEIGNIVIEKSGTPESFHNELRTEKSYRDFVKNQSELSKDDGMKR